MDPLDVEFYVFSGGGVKGIAYMGSLLALEEYHRRGWLRRESLRGCIGTSVGALFALACVIGVPCGKLFDMLFRDHLLADLEPALNLATVGSTFGLNDGGALRWMAASVLKQAGEDEAMTFSQLRDAGYPDLVVTCTNLSSMKVVHLSHANEPDMPVATAIAASMAVPVLFEPVTWREELLCDGALVENTPIHFFPLERSLVFCLGDAGPSLLPCTATEIHEAGFGAYLKRLLMCTLSNQNASPSAAGESRSLHILDVCHHSTEAETFSFGLGRREQLETLLAGLVLTHDGLYYLRLAQNRARCRARAASSLHHIVADTRDGVDGD